ncbi:SAM-dependent methyltransferase [Nocardioides speluncae]|uniref:SAM-dependent methyltransferase n=1 Tax=Nocardioides speluncae TaxID=2670337 RepID=UPI00137AC33B|nr:class I SAM-dependent methyltransferase [Nocardioides speluncae]
MPELTPFHLDLTFMTPLSATRADRLVSAMADDLTGTVADVGCGWAELLLRVLAAAPDARGIGIDLDAEAIEHGRTLAAARGLADRAMLVAGDVRDELPERAEAAICIGASQIWGPPVEEAQPLAYAAALGALRSLVPVGGQVLYGDGIWSAAPTAAAAAPLAGRLDEFVTLPELVELAVAAGFQPMQVHEATVDEWDEFESGFTAAYTRWLATHSADHSDATEVRERAARQRAAYFSGYRGVLGMAYLVLVAV